MLFLRGADLVAFAQIAADQMLTLAIAPEPYWLKTVCPRKTVRVTLVSAICSGLPAATSW